MWQYTTEHCLLSQYDKTLENNAVLHNVTEHYQTLPVVTMQEKLQTTAGCHNVTEHYRTVRVVTKWQNTKEHFLLLHSDRTLQKTAGCHNVS
jgi:tRNA G46 methylase TrmB